jgi:CheY-like chemotaxis protein
MGRMDDSLNPSIGPRSTQWRRVLIADDEAAIRELFARLLGDEFEVHTAADGSEALRLFHSLGPFGVVVADLHMPYMDGASLLAEIRRRTPDVTRVLVTGDSGVRAAVEAINAGHVFQFITKPFEPDTARHSIRLAFEEHCRARAEHELLEGTVKGSVRALAQVLALVNPAAFGRSARMAELTRHLAIAVDVDDPWKFETAALLSQVGWISVPAETAQRAHAGAALSEHEQRIIEAHPRVAYELLHEVPRLEEVAEMILGQLEESEFTEGARSDAQRLGRQMLRLASWIATAEQRGAARAEILARARQLKPSFDARLIASLDRMPEVDRTELCRMVGAAELHTGMRVVEDIFSKDGTLMLARGQQLTPAAVRLLQNVAHAGMLREPLAVSISTGGDSAPSRKAA